MKNIKTGKQTNTHHDTSSCIVHTRQTTRSGELERPHCMGEKDAKIERYEDKYKSCMPCKHAMFGDLGRGNRATLHGR